MKKFIVFFSLLLFFFYLARCAEAKLLPRFRSSSVGFRRPSTSGLAVSVRLRADRKALNVAFANLDKVKEVTYTLSYQANGKEEGVYGTINSSSGNTAAREFLFGTCSSGVCRYHTNISQMKFEVVAELFTGKKTIKRYRIRA